MHFVPVSDFDDDVSRLTAGRFRVEQDLRGMYLVCIRSNERVQLLEPVQSDFDFAKVDSLSARESEVFAMLGDACTMNDIAIRLGVSVKTAETYRARIKQKLEITTSTYLLHVATEWFLLQFRRNGERMSNQA